MALIELDLAAPHTPAPGRPPVRAYRFVAVFVAAVLVLTLGGAAAQSALRWQRTGLVPLGGADTSYQIVGGLLYTLDGQAGRRTTTAWSMRPLRRLWSVSTPLQLDPSGTVIHDSGAVLVRAGAYTVLRTAFGASVIDPRSGTVRWSSPVPVNVYSGGTGVVQETHFAPGTEYDQSSGDPGPLYWSPDGVPHTRPPERTVLRGLDLATGRQLWTVEERGSVFVVPVAGDSTGLVVLAADRLALLAADTGAVVRARTLPRFAYGDVSYPEVVGGLLLLRHDLADSGGGTATAFALDTFEQRWQVREPVANGDTGTCEGLPCEPEPGGLAVLDPRSGAARWHTDKYVNLIVRGPDALEVQGVSNHPLSVLDPDTGAVRVDLAGWQYVATSIGQAPMMFFRNEPDSGSIGFGVWSPGARYVRSLGRSSTPVRDCWNDERFVACRVDDGVEVWSYRA